MKPKRYHPLIILYDIWNYVKSMFVFAIILFVFNMGSQSFFFTYGRYAFYIISVLTFIYIVLKWCTRKYVIGDTAFHLYKGLIDKSEQTIPYFKIQNVNRHTTIFHRFVKMTALHFETAMTSENATVKFEVLSQKEAKQMEAFIEKKVKEQVLNDSNGEGVANEHSMKDDPGISEDNSDRKIHFNPEKRDLIKASFTSLSFLLLIPIILSFYAKLESLFQIEDRAEGIVAAIISTWWALVLVITLLIVVSVVFGMIRIYLKYGKYEIASDINRIYITQGTLNESVFSILKKNVQAIEISQSPLKRFLGLAEVKLISAGKAEMDNEKLEINSLYPFLPKDRAYEILEEILPNYEITNNWSTLPKRALSLRLFRSSWFFALVVIGLTYFKPTIYGISQAWWIIIVLLLGAMVTTIFLNYKNTKFVLNDQFIQMKKGGFTTTQLITKRAKIIEVKVSRSMLQRKLNISSFEMVNRANPVLHTNLNDVPAEIARTFYVWYMDRTKEIEMEK